MNIQTKIALRKLLDDKIRDAVLTSLHQVPLTDYSDYRHRLLYNVKTSEYDWMEIEWDVVKRILDWFGKRKFNNV